MRSRTVVTVLRGARGKNQNETKTSKLAISLAALRQRLLRRESEGLSFINHGTGRDELLLHSPGLHLSFHPLNHFSLRRVPTPGWVSERRELGRR